MLLDVRHLTKRFGGLTAVSDISFGLDEGDIVGVFGPNGSGKTTLLNLISGVYPPTEGQLLWKGQELVGSKPHEIAEAGIVKTFQNPQLFGELSVFDNVAIAGHLRLKRRVGWRRVATLFPLRRRTSADLAERIVHILRLCRLESFRHQPAASLSYGGEKMLGVAMALMCEPKVLLLDEPGSGLGHDDLRNLDAVLRDLRQQGTTLCVIDHRVGFLGNLADRAIVIHHGAKIAEGRPDEVLRDHAVIEAYLGRAHA
ncbi:MAG: ABC transporter ATP-binding protein [Casimicrobiaceae bacterium]|nr:ABC transporter ATP-binding protein [Pseudomonadota bacterium]